MLTYKIPPSPIIYNCVIYYALLKLPKYSFIPWKTGFVDQTVWKPEKDMLVHFITNRTMENTAHSIEANVIAIDMKSNFLIGKFGIGGDSGAPVLDKDWGLRGMYRGCSPRGQPEFGVCVNIIEIDQDIKIKQQLSKSKKSKKNFKKNFQKAFLAHWNCIKFYLNFKGEDHKKLIRRIFKHPDETCLIYNRRNRTISSINIENRLNIQEDFDTVGQIAVIIKPDNKLSRSQCFFAYATKKYIFTTYHSISADASDIFAFFRSKHYILIYRIPPPIIYCDKMDYALLELPKDSFIPWETGFVDKIVGKPEKDNIVHITTKRSIEKTAHSIEANVIETPIDVKYDVSESEFLIDKFGIGGDSGAPVLDKDGGLRGMYRGCIPWGKPEFGVCVNIIKIDQDIKIKQQLSKKTSNLKHF
ncbi:hypothetical protein COCON_G00224660 [Conger conger]|uniref:Uncharacterized protein n=1 Tax=Conger conger TaxID=82655 RepID=A0A9Q1CWH0_CONCO|nr:hypothetical protein COCON_G00224660 [Conger conger]